MVTRRKSVLVVAVAFGAVFTGGGVVFGFNAVAPELLRRGVFSSKCEEEQRQCPEEGCCAAQRERLALAASVSLFCADAVMVIYGEIKDRLGSISCLILGESFVVIGFFGLYLSFSNELGVSVSLVALALGGAGIFMGSLGLGQAYPSLEPLIATATAAAFDSSALVFVLMKGIGPILGCLEYAALAWCFICFVFGLLSIYALGRGSKSLLHHQESKETNSLSQLLEAEEEADAMQQIMTSSRIVKEKNSAWYQFQRADTILLLTFMALYNLKSNFFIETAADQARLVASLPSTATALTRLFDLAFPLGGFFSSFAVAAYLRDSDALDIVVFLANVVCCAHLIPLPLSHALAAVLFGPARTFQWAAYFHYFYSTTKAYPPTVVGRLLGYSNLVIAFVGDAGLPALVAYVQVDETAFLLPRSVKRRRFLHLNTGFALLVGTSSAALLLHLRHLRQPGSVVARRRRRNKSRRKNLLSS